MALEPSKNTANCIKRSNLFSDANSLSNSRKVESFNLSAAFLKYPAEFFQAQDEYGFVKRAVNSKLLKSAANILSKQSDLKYLDLSSNGLTSHQLQQLFKYLRTKKLVHINLANNDIDDDGAKTLAVLIQKSVNLTKLQINLAKNLIGIDGAKVLAEAIKKLPNLTSLQINLAENNIGANGVQELAEAIGGLGLLTKLQINLANNEIGIKGVQALAVAISRLPNLIILHLDLANNPQVESSGRAKSVRGVQSLAAEIRYLSRLTDFHLDLANNTIATKEVQALAMALSALSKLSNLGLNLEGNNIIIADANVLAKGIKGLPDLTSLEFNWVGLITLDTAHEQARLMKKFSQLTQIKIKLHNRYGDNIGFHQVGIQDAKVLAAAIKNSSRLTSVELDLADNILGNKGVQILAAAIKAAPQLTQVNFNLCNSNLGDKGVQALAEAVNNSTHLIRISFNLEFNKKISDQGVLALAVAIRNSTRLTALELKLGWNGIGAEAIKQLAYAIKNSAPCVTAVAIDFYYNNALNDRQELIEKLLIQHKNIHFGG